MAAMLFEVGDAIADFALPSETGSIVKLSDTVGVPVVLVFVESDSASASACRAFADRYAEFSSFNVPILAIRSGAPAGEDSLTTAPGGAAAALPFAILADTSGEVSRQYGARGLRVVLLDANAHVARFYDAVEPAALAALALRDARAMATREEPRRILQQAPVLLLSDVIPQEFRDELIRHWETQGNEDSGFMVVDGEKTVGKFDYSAKIRRDHFIVNGSDIYNRARDLIVRRVIMAVKKAFNYDVTRMEDIKIACYDAARGGYFRPHRDNTTPGTAHRRFAVSLLLNDDYEGGYLRFPEHGPHLYRPPAGCGVVFSGTLLHEATDVTAGRRFVLLTFLYGEKEARQREEYNRRTGGGYRAAQ